MEYYIVTAAGGSKGLSDTCNTETSIWKHTPPCPNTANENMPKMSSKPKTFRFFILIETSFSPYFGRCLCLVPPQQSCVILRRHEKFSTSCSGLRKIGRPTDPSVKPPGGKAQNSPHPCSQHCGTRGGCGSWEESGHETEPSIRLPVHHPHTDPEGRATRPRRSWSRRCSTKPRERSSSEKRNCLRQRWVVW